MVNTISRRFKLKRKELRLSQEVVARAIGVDQKTISHWENGINEPQLNKLRIFCNNFRVPLSYFTDEDSEKNTLKCNLVTLDFYYDIYASCGIGGIAASENSEKIALPLELMPKQIRPGKKYSVIKIRGNSMEPEIKDRDLVLIEHYGNEQIIDNHIYIFMYENEIFVKRLSKNINEVIITSDNKDYAQIILRKEEINKLYIIGKVYGFARKYF
ncbi:MAG: XRE family transcriptional regulator [Candidatus Gastranaerophilales bacterium]|nr:XRE family transcriptional regulator [Candidatus Gastranaerophilales bacterium]